MFNRLGFQCTCCGAPLTGGPDTFGTVDQPMCEMCYLKPVPDDTAAQHASMLRNRERLFLRREEKRLRSLYDEADALGQFDVITQQIEVIYQRARILGRQTRGVFISLE